MDFSKLTPSEFYTKYWLIELPDGSKVHPPPLSEKERIYMDEVWGNPNIKSIYYSRKRRRSVTVDVETMKSDMGKIPDFLKMTETERLLMQQKIGKFIPVNQPDKYGNQQILNQKIPKNKIINKL